MRSKLNVTAMAAIGLLFLGACSSGNQATAPASSPTASVPAVTQPSTAATPAAKAESGDKHGGQGGQVLEVGAYHLELVPEKEADVTHLDVFLQTGDQHEAVPNAKVTAQVQLPDGSQKNLAFKYDPTEKHYTAKLPGAAAGAYKVAILSDIDGKKVNGRFNFTR